nr:MAG TPA: hypothetical protein [Caudoviricetes sp.]
MYFSGLVIYINAKPVNFVLCIGFHNNALFLGLYCPFCYSISYHRLQKQDLQKYFALLGWGRVALRCSPAKMSDRRHLDALNSAEKNQKKNRIQEKIMRASPF